MHLLQHVFIILFHCTQRCATSVNNVFLFSSGRYSRSFPFRFASIVYGGNNSGRPVHCSRWSFIMTHNRAVHFTFLSSSLCSVISFFFVTRCCCISFLALSFFSLHRYTMRTLNIGLSMGWYSHNKSHTQKRQQPIYRTGYRDPINKKSHRFSSRQWKGWRRRSRCMMTSQSADRSLDLCRLFVFLCCFFFAPSFCHAKISLSFFIITEPTV